MALMNPQVGGPIVARGGKVVAKMIERYVERIAAGETFAKSDLEVSAHLIQDYFEKAPRFLGDFLAKIADVSKNADAEALKNLEHLASVFEAKPEIQALVVKEAVRAHGEKSAEIWRTGKWMAVGGLGAASIIAVAWIHRPDP